MWKLHRYYLREVLITSMMTFVVLFGIVLIASIYRGIDRARGGDLVSAALITCLWTADTFPHLLSMGLLIGSVLSFARASQDREITAIRAAGISPRVPMVAALMIGLGFSIAGSYTQHYLIPWAHYYKYRVVSQAIRDFVINTRMNGNKMSFGRFAMAWENEDDRGHLHGVLVKRGRSPSGDPEAEGAGDIYLAEEAWLDISPDGETITLQLRGVETLLAGDQGARIDGISFDFNLRRITEGTRRLEGDKDLTSDQLLSEVYRGVHDRPDGARFTVHRRACFALMPALFAPLGFCIGVLSRDRGRMTALLFGMVPMIIFYGCVTLAPTLVRQWNWPPIAWLPAMVVGALGIPFCWRLLRL
ncbi:MAG: LptF/LptG family permease [Planctomycetota bacterium]